MSLNAKIIFILAIFVFGSTAISAIGVSKMNELNDSLNNIVDVVSKRVLYATQLDSAMNEIRNEEKVFILEESVDQMHKIDGNIDRMETDARKLMADYKSIADEQGRANADEASKALDDWKLVSKQLRELSLAGKNAEATALARGKATEMLNKFDSIFDKVRERNLAAMDQESKRTDVLYADSRNLVIGTAVAAIISGILLAFFVLRSLSRTIDRVISSLSDGSAQVTAAAHQIASSSEELSQATTEQASALQETSASVEEMNSMVKRNSEAAKQSSDVSLVSSSSASKGQTVVEDMIRSMRDIDAANNDIMRQTSESNQRIAEIVKVINEIGSKTKVINEIVFQTKLLSFNASVEAARAGEHGKGFAVVAEEVGNLAQMSGNAAKEITAMLDSSVQKVESIVSETKVGVERLIAHSKAKVESGTAIARSCGEVLREIVGNVSSVTEMSQSISSASDEQARGIHEITRAINQLDQMTQQNAAASEETAGAAEELSAQAESMRKVVQLLVATIRGAGAREIESSAAPTALAAHQAARPAKGGGGRVIPIGAQKTARSRMPQMPSDAFAGKTAVGSDLAPSADDARFES